PVFLPLVPNRVASTPLFARVPTSMSATCIPIESARIKPVDASFASVKRPRLESVDLLRGLIMIIMALDHNRDFFTNATVFPTDPANTTVALFFTRWITHFCAPVFFLLTGTGAYLSLRRKSKRELSRFLFTRGLWLILLDAVVLRCLAMQFNFDFSWQRASPSRHS
ncbi:MAG TPA: heparan-alpha-glucosaminide N-acetyltransferase domain-containing protein, partial [Candidatus Acidoferrum sp.]